MAGTPRAPKSTSDETNADVRVAGGAAQSHVRVGPSGICFVFTQIPQIQPIMLRSCPIVPKFRLTLRAGGGGADARALLRHSARVGRQPPGGG
jgi:hypothetical protein